MTLRESFKMMIWSRWKSLTLIRGKRITLASASLLAKPSSKRPYTDDHSTFKENSTTKSTFTIFKWERRIITYYELIVAIPHSIITLFYAKLVNGIPSNGDAIIVDILNINDSILIFFPINKIISPPCRNGPSFSFLRNLRRLAKYVLYAKLMTFY